MWTVHEGDALEVLRKLPDCSAHALVTDPPAGIAFMGREWDSDKGGRAHWVAWLAAILTEARRVLRPGAHALVWALPRTSHWTACALEDAGFEVRDVLVHLFGTGFPKSLDVSKALDKAAGAEREAIGRGTAGATWGKGATGAFRGGFRYSQDFAITAPATDAAATWQGWGTALKPAAEHWILARVPLEGTVASNVLAHGTGAINVDGCRIGSTVETWPSSRSYAPGQIQPGGRGETMATGPVPAGRWPSNVVLSGDAPELLDAQSGQLQPGVRPGRRTGIGYHGGNGTDSGARWQQLDGGGASRFFYCAKANSSERYAHLSCNCPTPELTAWESAPDAAPAPPPRARGSHTLDLFAELSATTPATPAGSGVVVPAGSPLAVRRSVCAKCGGAVRTESHPTQKPVELMRWLVRLVTPPGGTVLDPFAGSGTTVLACLAEGMDCIGIERQPEYAALARERAHSVAPLLRTGEGG